MLRIPHPAHPPRRRRAVPRAFVSRAFVRWAITACAAAAPTAQAQARGPAPDECIRMSFGRWDPPLDWVAAGQPGASPGAPDAAAARRDNAAHTTSGDSTIMVYPSWWPAGVEVHWERARTAGDTLSGLAVALVADGRARSPSTRVRAVRVPCAGGHA